ncbi:hypothetical protein J4037_11470 [Cellulomonas sp. zg-ZUI168]|nr:hypothetical protein [Cellulomonas fengjieae]
MLALAPVANPVVVERAFGDHGVFSLECSFTYELATTSEAPVFTLKVTSSDGAQVEAEKVVGRDELASGTGPDLAVVFCPTCGF